MSNHVKRFAFFWWCPNFAKVARSVSAFWWPQGPAPTGVQTFVSKNGLSFQNSAKWRKHRVNQGETWPNNLATKTELFATCEIFGKSPGWCGRRWADLWKAQRSAAGLRWICLWQREWMEYYGMLSLISCNLKLLVYFRTADIMILGWTTGLVSLVLLCGTCSVDLTMNVDQQ